MRASSACFLLSGAENVLIILRVEAASRRNVGLLAVDRGADGGGAGLFMFRAVHATRHMRVLRVDEVIMAVRGSGFAV